MSQTNQPIYFVFTLHNHQPVGNFDNVFQEAYEKSYKPFLDVFEKTKTIKICLHTTGPLFDWLEKNQPAYLKRLKVLVKKGRIEILGGGYYEPLLSLLRPNDAVGQLKKMNSYLAKEFGREPNGFWLAERVWEATLPSLVQRAGLKYTCLDDAHFQYAGFEPNELDGYYITENEGKTLAIFPINKTLRYTVPFQEVHKVYEYIKEAYKRGVKVLNLADDGEKFGLWPTTHELVYKQGWLKDFFQMLEDCNDWLKTTTYSQLLDELPPSGKVYLPNASYEEMMEWSLEGRKSLALKSLKKKLEAVDWARGSEAFIRGGYFRNFLSKYSESGMMQSKQYYVSQKIEGSRSNNAKTAVDYLYKGQCNCPYWHGVFGGTYLHHLRRATYGNLIHSEKLIDERGEKKYKEKRLLTDYNQDGVEEFVWETATQNLVVAPSQGGQIIEWDNLEHEVNLTDTMTRRFEAYHDDIQNRPANEETESDNIHELRREIKAEVLENLAFDKHVRHSWCERIFKQGSLTDLKSGNLKELINLNESKFDLTHTQKKLTLKAEFNIEDSYFSLIKTLIPTAAGFVMAYDFSHISGKPLKFNVGSEWNLNLKASDLAGTLTKQWVLEDEWSSLAIEVESAREFEIFQYTILTVAQSELEYNLSAQGTCLIPFWNLDFTQQKRETWSWEMRIKEKK